MARNMTTSTRSMPPIVGVPAFTEVPHRAFRPDRLAEAEPLEEADVDRAEDDDAEEREQQAEDDRQHAGHRRMPVGAAASASTARSRPMPRDALRSTTSPMVGGQLALDLLHRGVGVVDAHDVPEAGGTRRLGDPAAPVADRHQAIDDAGRQPADLAMLPLLVGPELQHVAEDGIAATAGRKRASRRGARALPPRSRRAALYVSSMSVAPPAASIGAMRCAAWLPAASAVSTSSSGMPKRSATAAAASACGTRWRPGHGEPQAPHAPRCGERERGAGDAVADHLAGADVGAGAEAERASPRRRSAAAMAATRGSSALRTARPSPGSAAGSSRLRARDRLDAAGAQQVRWLDGQDDADLGARDLRQARDLALGVHAHLEHRHRCASAQAEEGHRQAGLAVQVPLVAQDASRCATARRRRSPWRSSCRSSR